MGPRTATKKAPRGPAALRHDRQTRDKDGDMAMGGPVKGRAGISKKTPAAKANGRDLTSRVGAKKGLLDATAQREILKRAGAGDVAMREAKINAPRGQVELKVGNWSKNKASTNADGGVSSLISWLEKKASSRLGSRTRSVKIKKVCCRLQHSSSAGHRLEYPRRMTILISGLPSLARKTRTTTAISNAGLRLPYG